MSDDDLKALKKVLRAICSRAPVYSPVFFHEALTDQQLEDARRLNLICRQVDESGQHAGWWRIISPDCIVKRPEKRKPISV